MKLASYLRNACAALELAMTSSFAYSQQCEIGADLNGDGVPAGKQNG